MGRKRDDGLRSAVGTPKFPSYVAAYPHVLIPSGFDEVRMGFLSSTAEMLRTGFVSAEALAAFNWDALPPEAYRHQPTAFFRQASSGVWFFPWLYQPGRSDQTGLPLDTLGIFRGESDGGWRIVLKRVNSKGWYSADRDICLTDDSVLAAYERTANSPGPGTVVLPELFRHPVEHPRIELLEATKNLLGALQREKIAFPELTWQQVEDVVAELLRARGLQITVTPRSRDGGRDLIARGELIPGEPSTLAIEIKHKSVVGLDEVTSRMHRNKDFPALLFATTGRFTAGVVREKMKPEHFLRLLLKDGTALRQWIQEYES